MYGYHSKTEMNTGVFSQGSLEWLPDELYNAIDVTLEEYLESPEYKELSDEEKDTALDWYDTSESTFLIGDWRKDEDGLYEPYPNGEYSGIVLNNPFYVVQIVLSQWGIMSHYCSPCFPSQCDGDTPGEYPAYAPPPDLCGNNFERINEISPIDIPPPDILRIDPILEWEIT